LPYYRIKLEVERYVQACGLPWTILRTTQFHNLVFELIRASARLPIMLLPASTSCQPVDVRDVASRVAALVGSGSAGRVPDLGGPQVLPAVDLAYDYLQVFERRRIVLPVRIPGKIGRGYRNGGHLTPEHADGRRSFHNFLLEESQKPTRTPLDANEARQA